MAGTNLNTEVAVTTYFNDFDPDGDSFASLPSTPPPTARSEHSAATTSTTYPTPATPASKPSPTNSATATACSRQDSSRSTSTPASHRPATSPNVDTDYAVVYQGSSVGFTVADLLLNDSDPQNQPLTVLAVSQPSTDGVLSGTLASGFIYTPSTDASFVNTDHPINYLVTDTDGHISDGHPRSASSPLATPTGHRWPAAMWRERTSTTEVAVTTDFNDFDPDGDSFVIVAVTPPPTARSETFGGNYFYYVPNTGFSGLETITYKLRDSHGMLSTASSRSTSTPVRLTARTRTDTDYAVVYQGSTCRAHRPICCSTTPTLKTSR